MYQEMTGILQQQEQFAKKDLIGGKYIPFIMILDKGYRIAMAAWKQGSTNMYPAYFYELGSYFYYR